MFFDTITEMKVCSIEECESKKYIHGYCIKHYQRWKAHGDPLYEKPLQQVACTCLNCGKDFIVSTSQHKNGHGKYCSTECSNVGRRNRVERRCEICDKSFYLKKSAVERGFGIYCSMECKAIGLSKRFKGRKGRKHTEAQKKVASERMKKEYETGKRKPPDKFPGGSYWLGKKLPAERVARMSEIGKERFKNGELPEGFLHNKNFLGKTHTPEARAKIAHSRMGTKNPMYGKTNEQHPNWKGDDVGYYGLHDWLTARFGQPIGCEWCGEDDPEKRYEWANISGEYRRDRDDFVRLCKKCHNDYDGVNAWQQPRK